MYGRTAKIVSETYTKIESRERAQNILFGLLLFSTVLSFVHLENLIFFEEAIRKLA